MKNLTIKNMVPVLIDLINITQTSNKIRIKTKTKYNLSITETKYINPTYKINKYILDIFRKNNIPFIEDEVGNIYNLVRNKPLLSAHMDTVQTHTDTEYIDSKIKKYKSHFFIEENADGNTVIFNNHIIGFDDKAGVALIINYLLENKNISFLLSTGEESGSIGAKHFLETNKNKIKELNIPYAIILDRKGAGDFCVEGIGKQYSSKEFQKEINHQLDINQYGYKFTRGVYSDCDTLCEVINCFNLSVGYYNQHTNKELLVLEEWYNSYNFMKYIIENYKHNYNIKLPININMYKFIEEEKSYSFEELENGRVIINILYDTVFNEDVLLEAGIYYYSKEDIQEDEDGFEVKYYTFIETDYNQKIELEPGYYFFNYCYNDKDNDDLNDILF